MPRWAETRHMHLVEGIPRRQVARECRFVAVRGVRFRERRERVWVGSTTPPGIPGDPAPRGALEGQVKRRCGRGKRKG